MTLFGLDNTPQAVGWILALASECMCPILVTLNWSIISESAKDYSSSAAASAFPMITMACQLGCLLGSSITNYLARTGAQTRRRGGDGFMNNNMSPDDDDDDDAINNYTALLPVLLCGLSLCGMWACMVKADECYAKDRSHRRSSSSPLKATASAAMEHHPVDDDDLPLDHNDEEEDWVAQYHHHNDDDGGSAHHSHVATTRSSSNRRYRRWKMMMRLIVGSVRGLQRILSSFYVLSIFIVSTAYEYFDTAFDLQIKHLFTQKAIADCQQQQHYNNQLSMVNWLPTTDDDDHHHHTFIIPAHHNNSMDDAAAVAECRHAHFLASYSRNSLNVALLSTTLAVVSAILHARRGRRRNSKTRRRKSSSCDDDDTSSDSQRSVWGRCSRAVRCITSSILPSSFIGPTFPLLLYPIIVGICFWVVAMTTLTPNDDIITTLLHNNNTSLLLSRTLWYVLGSSSMIVRQTVAVQMSVMAVKAFGYTLNNPAKEMLYLNTTQDVRFQAKSWIDIWCPKLWSALAAMVCYQFMMITPDDDHHVNGTATVHDGHYNDAIGGDDDDIIISGGSSSYGHNNNLLLKMTMRGMSNMGMIAIVGLMVLFIWSLAAIYATTEFNRRENLKKKQQDQSTEDGEHDNELSGGETSGRGNVVAV
ncbi:hypothetical protein FOZ63_032496 [Perkinsus olseni]|uniref:Uncharacterized protein n=1 Tax=Perkinsus olseni TaxID=32597 RepID=A0A7J6UN28_PEROL|nr:hypothetical protein FOZ63_032496 [Perkinsus olseni]